MVMLELVSEDYNCVRIMHVKYTAGGTAGIVLRRSGYNFAVELPADCTAVEVSFSVLGGRAIHKVDCTDPALPWVRNCDGKKEREHFVYHENPPLHVQYFVTGPSWGSFISNVVEYPGGQLSLKRAPSDTLPAIGGLDAGMPLPEHILPPEVLLYVPTPEDVRKEAHRMIFLNTPLEDAEQKAVVEFYEALEAEGKQLPHCSQIHILRLLQHAKGNIKKAIKQMECNVVARHKYFSNTAATDTSLQHDLQKGVLYFHGRDFKMRPCLVIRCSRIDKECFDDPHRLCKVAVFLLETVIRYGMCPGRVENWGVIIDMADAGAHGVPPLRLITSLVETLQNMYRFRMAWTKIVNGPWWFAAMWSGIKRAIPGESVKKVEIVSGNGAEALTKLFNPAQLEARYGGTAPTLDDPSDFPFRFYPGPFSSSAEAAKIEAEAMAAAIEAARQDPATSSDEFDLLRLHEITGVETHEGRLWVRGKEDTWLPTVSRSIITNASAKYLEANFQTEVAPAESVTELLTHLAARNHEFRSTSMAELPVDEEVSGEQALARDASVGPATSPEAIEIEANLFLTSIPEVDESTGLSRPSEGPTEQKATSNGGASPQRLPVLLGHAAAFGNPQVQHDVDIKQAALGQPLVDEPPVYACCGMWGFTPAQRTLTPMSL
eukprot:TRINITY_DN2863_c0_g1_i3.p1 TRINITY_DN2863_c0_g1~~TRINITY_DN2863_c0_g1_i3.p1  ORF type:complete len:660 (+),score=160.29 TRINITY_DN2863_c0_g1_i3:135-2114(+)